MRKRIVVGMAVLGLLIAAGTALAGTFKVTVRLGDIVLKAKGGFSPNTLPKFKDAPISVHGGGKLSTLSGDLPPILDTFIIEFDRHGHVETDGLAVCTKAKLVATDVPAARRACGEAIVGQGVGRAVVAFPEQGHIDVSSPITLFNGPKKGRNDTIIAHAHLDYPGPTTFIVPIVIEKINNGVFGYRVKVKIPKIAGGYGHPIEGSSKVGKKWTYKGKQLSYINARCETGRFQARGEFTFKDGTVMKASFLLPCKVRN
jgi:hypothetical protein